MTSENAVYDFVDLLNKDKALLARFEREPKVVLQQAKLSDEQRDALFDGSPSRLAEIGIHPLVLMRYSLARNPEIAELISARDYLVDLGEDKL
tara:strand:+ start:15571 stop:15849 length:279 start_codon:yes stop_codon:yes gene_type:complete